MSELSKILHQVQQNFDNLKDKKRSLAVILGDRRINSGQEGVTVFLEGMTQSLEGSDAVKAKQLLAGLIGRKNLLENSKKKK